MGFPCVCKWFAQKRKSATGLNMFWSRMFFRRRWDHNIGIYDYRIKNNEIEIENDLLSSHRLRRFGDFQQDITHHVRIWQQRQCRSTSQNWRKHKKATCARNNRDYSRWGCEWKSRRKKWVSHSRQKKIKIFFRKRFQSEWRALWDYLLLVPDRQVPNKIR